MCVCVSVCGERPSHPRAAAPETQLHMHFPHFPDKNKTNKNENEFKAKKKVKIKVSLQGMWVVKAT